MITSVLVVWLFRISRLVFGVFEMRFHADV